MADKCEFGTSSIIGICVIFVLFVIILILFGKSNNDNNNEKFNYPLYNYALLNPTEASYVINKLNGDTVNNGYNDFSKGINDMRIYNMKKCGPDECEYNTCKTSKDCGSLQSCIYTIDNPDPSDTGKCVYNIYNDCIYGGVC